MPYIKCRCVSLSSGLPLSPEFKLTPWCSATYFRVLFPHSLCLAQLFFLPRWLSGYKLKNSLSGWCRDSYRVPPADVQQLETTHNHITARYIWQASSEAASCSMKLTMRISEIVHKKLEQDTILQRGQLPRWWPSRSRPPCSSSSAPTYITAETTAPACITLQQATTHRPVPPSTHVLPFIVNCTCPHPETRSPTPHASSALFPHHVDIDPYHQLPASHH